MSIGGRGINPGTTVKRCELTVGDKDEEEDLPEDWPKHPHSVEELCARAKAFLDGACVPPEGDSRAQKQGRWFRFQGAEANAPGVPVVFVHNYTLDVSLDPPANLQELTDKQKKLLGLDVTVLPDMVRRVHDVQKKVPIVYCSESTCEMVRNFATYSADHQLLDTAKLKRVSANVLEECRQAVVGALRYGKMLCVHVGDPVCDFAEKVCISKNRDTFPVGLFQHGGLDSEMARGKLYRPEDMEAGQCVARSGFGVFLLAAFDGSGGGSLDMSSNRHDELRRIPGLEHMLELRCHSEEDRIKLLREKQ